MMSATMAAEWRRIHPATGTPTILQRDSVAPVLGGSVVVGVGGGSDNVSERLPAAGEEMNRRTNELYSLVLAVLKGVAHPPASIAPLPVTPGSGRNVYLRSLSDCRRRNGSSPSEQSAPFWAGYSSNG